MREHDSRRPGYARPTTFTDASIDTRRMDGLIIDRVPSKRMNLVVLRAAEGKLVYLLMGLSTCQVLWHSWDGCAPTRLG